MKKIILPDGDEVWDYNEAAKFMGVSYNTVLNYKNRKKNPMPFIPISSKEQGVRKSSLIAWILNQEKNSNNKTQKESTNAQVSRGV